MSARAAVPRVSVVMPVHNRDWCVAEAVASVLATREPSLELVVVDDGSTDGTAAILAGCAARDARVRVFAHPGRANRGIARSRNLGVAHSRGSYLAFLDSDDLYLPGRFAHALDWLDAHPRADACIEPSVVRDEAAGTVSALHRNLTAVAGGGTGWLREMLYATNYWHTGAITVRRERLARYGRFDERLRFAEETSLWLRLAAAGTVGSAQSHEAVVVMRHHDRGHSWDPQDRAADARTFLHVLLDTIAWAERTPDAGLPARALLRGKLRTYAVELLSDGRLPLPLRLGAWLRTVAHAPGLALDRALLANLAYAPLRRPTGHPAP